MNRRQFTAAIVAIAAALTAGPTALFAEDAVTLRYKGKVGDKLIYKNTLTTDVSQTFMGNDIDVKISQSDVTSYVLKQIGEGGTLHFETTNESLKVEGDFGPGGKYEFDSKADDHDTASEIGAAATPLYERLSGAILGVDITPQGKVNKVTGYADLVKDILEGNPIAARFAGGGTDEAALNSIQDQFVVFPEKAVKPGDTWEEPFKMKLPGVGEFEGKRVYTFVGPDKVRSRRTLKITIDTEIAGDLDIDSGDSSVKGKLEADKSSGTAQFDPVAGLIVSYSSEQVMSGDLTVAVGNQTIPVSMDQKITVTRMLLKDVPE